MRFESGSSLKIASDTFSRMLFNSSFVLLQLCGHLFKCLLLRNPLRYINCSHKSRFFSFECEAKGMDVHQYLLPTFFMCRWCRFSLWELVTQDVLITARISDSAFFRPDLQDGHGLEFLLGISIQLNGCLIHFEEPQCL